MVYYRGCARMYALFPRTRDAGAHPRVRRGRTWRSRHAVCAARRRTASSNRIPLRRCRARSVPVAVSWFVSIQVDSTRIDAQPSERTQNRGKNLRGFHLLESHQLKSQRTLGNGGRGARALLRACRPRSTGLRVQATPIPIPFIGETIRTGVACHRR